MTYSVLMGVSSLLTQSLHILSCCLIGPFSMLPMSSAPDCIQFSIEKSIAILRQDFYRPDALRETQPTVSNNWRQVSAISNVPDVHTLTFRVTTEAVNCFNTIHNVR